MRVLDPEVAAAFVALASAGPARPVIESGDWRALRVASDEGMAAAALLYPTFPDGFPGVRGEVHELRTEDGSHLEVRAYLPRTGPKGSAVVFVHGGGMLAGTLDAYEPIVADYVARTGVYLVSVAYRLAPEVRGETPARDVHVALKWLIHQAVDIGVDPARVCVMGDSAGGGIAAGVARLARDEGIALARQVLIYPMLDDRTVRADPDIEPYLTWTAEQNRTGWQALLGDLSEDPSPVAVPARGTDLAGLAPAFIEVGELDLFCAESLAYAHNLVRAGVPVELHVHPGVPHAFERIAPYAKVARRVMSDRVRVLRSI